MTVQFRQPPTYLEPLTQGKNTSSSWYRYFQQRELGTPPAAESAITVTASPFTYIALRAGFVIVSGGTVSAIAFSRTAGTFYVTGQTSGVFSMSLNDSLRVTYSGLPTMTFV